MATNTIKQNRSGTIQCRQEKRQAPQKPMQQRPPRNVSTEKGGNYGNVSSNPSPKK